MLQSNTVSTLTGVTVFSCRSPVSSGPLPCTTLNQCCDGRRRVRVSGDSLATSVAVAAVSVYRHLDLN